MIDRLGTILLLILSLSFTSCKKTTSTEVDGLQSIPATRQQIELPWPGLAQSAWPMYLHDPQHTGRSSYRGPQEGKVKWVYDTGGLIYSSPALAEDGTIYVSSFDHFLHALSPVGGLKWKVDMGDIAEATVAIGKDGTIYAGSADTNFLALNPSGTLHTMELQCGRSEFGCCRVRGRGDHLCRGRKSREQSVCIPVCFSCQWLPQVGFCTNG
jgi:hypothetical protein